ncbi:MAG: leucine-rich repeat domain-containing protein [Bacteroidales bacterium]|nr:leucine-rich repeat domain-containing protein [Bacteroidales bacterium]
MSKRKLISLLGLMTIVCSLTAQTQDAVSGLWYTSTVAGHATIVAPPAGEAAYTGAVRIPSTIVGSEGTYTVDTIGQNAFKSSNITLVEIPATVNFIGVYAFSSCTTLATIRCHATTPPTLGTIKMVNMETGKSTTFYPFDDTRFSTLSPQVPDKDAYTAATGWAKFTKGFNNIIYDITIAGIEVTAENKDNITGEGITGTVRYDNETNVLLLSDAAITAASKTHGVEFYEPDLTIRLEGKNTISPSDYSCIYVGAAGTITGPGSLKNIGDIVTDANLTFKNTTVKADRLYVEDPGSTDATFAFDKAYVTLSGDRNYETIICSELNLTDCEFLYPASASFSATKKAVVDADGYGIIDDIVIGRTYGITVAGVSVHELNKDNVIGEGITGTVRYDIDTKTLTLDNAKIASAASACIDISRDINVLIELIGEDSLAQTGGTSALYIGQNDTITIAGDGSLTIESSQNGISLSSASQLTISECQVAVNGATKGITGIDGTKGETLILDKAIVRAKGTAQGSICNLQTLDFNGCSIVLPESAIWKLANHQIESKDGSVVKDEVVIARVYPVYVAGVQLNAINKDDIATAAGISTGTITFDDENNVLTLENVVLETAKNGIETIGSTGLTIELVGENSITSNKNGISAYTALTIDGNGSGKLEIAADNTALSSLSESLVISKAEVTASGAQYGIYGSYNSELEISKSTVRAKGTTQGSITRFKSITLTGCSIATEGATVALSAEDATDYSVMVEGAIATAEVVIEPKTTAIETIAAEQPLFYAHDGRIYGAEGMRIYTLLGLDVTHLNGQLNGVYIVKTADSAQKIVVR